MACVTVALGLIFSPVTAHPAMLIQLDVEATLNSGDIFTFKAIANFDPFKDNDSFSEFRTFDQIAMTVDEQPYFINEPISFQYFNAATVLGGGDQGLLRTGGLDTNLSRIDTLPPGQNDFFFQLAGFYNFGQQELVQPRIVPGGLVNRSNPSGDNKILVDDARVSVSIVPLPGALPLFATGLAGFGWLMRRRRYAAER